MASSDLGLSVKRTDFEGLGEVTVGRFNEDGDEGCRGCGSLAWANSGLKAGSLGCNLVEEDVVGKPRNWEVKSSNCDRKRVAWSFKSVAFLAELLDSILGKEG